MMLDGGNLFVQVILEVDSYQIRCIGEFGVIYGYYIDSVRQINIIILNFDFILINNCFVILNNLKVC